MIPGLEDPLEKGMATHSRQVFLPGEPHGQQRLAGYSPWDCKGSDTTEPLSHPALQADSLPAEQPGKHTKCTQTSTNVPQVTEALFFVFFLIILSLCFPEHIICIYLLSIY